MRARSSEILLSAIFYKTKKLNVANYLVYISYVKKLWREKKKILDIINIDGQVSRGRFIFVVNEPKLNHLNQ